MSAASRGRPRVIIAILCKSKLTTVKSFYSDKQDLTLIPANNQSIFNLAIMHLVSLANMISHITNLHGFHNYHIYKFKMYFYAVRSLLEKKKKSVEVASSFRSLLKIE